MISRRSALWLVPIIAIITFPLWKIPIAAFLAPPGGYDPNFVQKKTSSHNFIMTNVILQQSENGKQTAAIKAQKARSSSRADEYILDVVHADIHDDDGSTITVTSMAGNYNGVRDQLFLKGDVTINNPLEKYRMETEELYYDGGKGMLFCPQKTLLSGEGITITGSSFRYDMMKGEYTITGRVHSTLHGYTGS